MNVFPVRLLKLSLLTTLAAVAVSAGMHAFFINFLTDIPARPLGYLTHPDDPTNRYARYIDTVERMGKDTVPKMVSRLSRKHPDLGYIHLGTVCKMGTRNAKKTPVSRIKYIPRKHQGMFRTGSNDSNPTMQGLALLGSPSSATPYEWVSEPSIDPEVALDALAGDNLHKVRF